jgi:hypothetical protein
MGIEWLCNRVNMSFKAFERHFDQKVGTAAKLYSEISSLQNDG